MDGELTLLIDRRDAVVRLDGPTVRVDTPDGGTTRAPLGLLGIVVVYGNPVVSCDVWRALAERQVPAVLLPGRGNADPAWLGAGLHASVRLRVAQHQAWNRPQSRLEAARILVAMKLRATLAALDLLERQPGANRSLAKSVRTFIADQITALAFAADVPALMGLEGAAAADWYAYLGKHVPTCWRFRGRNRRPPRDPVNSLLSLGYTLAGTEVRGVIARVGLDAALGFLHSVHPGRESLALDLVEPLRPGVDAFALSLLGTALTPTDFRYSAAEGCRLTKEARGIFYARWAAVRRAWPIPAIPGPVVTELQPLAAEATGVVGVLRGLIGAGSEAQWSDWQEDEDG